MRAGRYRVTVVRKVTQEVPPEVARPVSKVEIGLERPLCASLKRHGSVPRTSQDDLSATVLTRSPQPSPSAAYTSLMCSDATDQERSMVRAIQWLSSEPKGLKSVLTTHTDAGGTHLQGEFPPHELSVQPHEANVLMRRRA